MQIFGRLEFCLKRIALNKLFIIYVGYIHKDYVQIKVNDRIVQCIGYRACTCSQSPV